MRYFKYIMAILVFLIPLLAQAEPMSFHYEKSNLVQVTTEPNGGPNLWIRLYFPDGGPLDSYPNGIFEYDDYIDSVSELKITLDGRDEYGEKPIDIFIDFNKDHSSYTKIATFTQTSLTRSGNSNAFKLVMDVLNNQLILVTNYDNNLVTTDVGDLVNIDENDFGGIDKFYIGYGCHFDHVKSEVDVTVNPTPTPEPATMLLLGLGLVGLAGVRRKFEN